MVFAGACGLAWSGGTENMVGFVAAPLAWAVAHSVGPMVMGLGGRIDTGWNVKPESSVLGLGDAGLWGEGHRSGDKGGLIPEPPALTL